jgi:predicted negative regulator of RcsB-dependent stress response
VDIHRTEEEQIEALKRFFKEYGSKLLITMVALVALFFGYQGWMKNQQNEIEQASTYYNELRVLAESAGEAQPDTRAKFDEVFARLLAEHADSIYASYASLLKAKLNVEGNDLDKAAQALQWVIDAAANPEIVALANLRLAHVVFAQGDNEKALALLNAESAPFSSSYEELRGDIYVEMKQLDKALAGYKKAKELKTDKKSFEDRLLDMKIDSLTVVDSSALPAVEAATPAQPVETK